MQGAAVSYLKRLAPAYLTVLSLYQLLLYFAVGSIFHGLFLPMVDHARYVFVWATSIVLIPFVANAYGQDWQRRRLPELLYFVSCGLFISLVALRRVGRHHCAPDLVAALTVFMFLFLAPKLLKRKHFLVLFWFICVLAGIHSFSQICFVIGQTQQFLGYNVCMPHGRLMHVPEFPLLRLLDGYTGGWFTNPNCLASYVMAVPAISIFLSQPKLTKMRALRILCWFICALTSISILLTFSRAAILSTMIGMVPLAVYVLSKRKVSFFASLVAICALIVGLFLLQMRFTTLPNPLSLTGRLDLWTEVLSLLKHLPIFGYGPMRLASGETPHNVYLSHLICYGVPGLTAFLVMIGTSIYLAWRVVRRDNGYGVWALFGFVVSYVCAYSQIEFVLTCPSSFSNSVALLIIGFLVYQSNKSAGTEVGSPCAPNSKTETVAWVRS